MDKYEELEKVMCTELETLERKIKSSGAEMSMSDLEKIDKLAHAMKCLATYKAMKEAEEMEEGMSGRRGRAANGRFVSRESAASAASYADGYSQGYSEAMRQQSGHYPAAVPPISGYRY